MTISDGIIDMLIDPDPAVRKRGVTTLGKSKDLDALPYLAEVYRDDEDAEVRELARKAGIYIKKNAPPKPSPRTEVETPASTYTDIYGDGDSLYDDDEEEDEDDYANASQTPLPSQIRVTQAQEERARGLVQQALDLNMRGDNTRATRTLEKALQLDPRLVNDSYTLSLAATITGMNGREAVQSLAPSDAELQKRVVSGSGKRSPFQLLLAYLIIVGGVTTLMGYFLFAWVDMSSVEVTDDTGAVTTIGASMDELRGELDSDEAQAGLAMLVGEEQAEEMISALRGLNFDLTGWETTSVTLGFSDVGDVTGLNRLVDALNLLEEILGDMFGFDFDLDNAQTDDEPISPSTLDYILILAPIASGLAILVGIMLLMGGARMREWIGAVIVGVIGMAPLVYFYIDAVTAVLGEDDNLGALGEVAQINATDLIGLGFWVSVVGMVMVLLLPFIAMLTQPTQADL